MREHLTRGRFGIVLAVGAAAAITRGDRPVVAAVTVVFALAAVLAVDRRKA